jgi:hypothetical protein
MRRFPNQSALATSCLATSLLFLCGQASAGEVREYPPCDKVPTDSDVQGAKGAFQAGTVSYNEADYERAILFWEDAYRRDCTATLLLLHLARAYEGQGNLEQALVALRAYLDRAPANAPDRAKAERLVVAFRQKLDTKRQVQVDPEVEKKAVDQPPPPAESKPVQPSPARESNSLYVSPFIPVAVAGVGISAFVVGGILFGTAQADVNDYESQCPGRRCPQDVDSSVLKDAEQARSRRDWGLGIGITGLVLAAGGVGWHFFNAQQKPTEPPAQASFAPLLSPKVVGFSYRAAF